MVEEKDIEAFQRDGAVCLRGVFKDWVAAMAAGIERNMAEPGPYASENFTTGDTGRFFDDYCNWERIPEFRDMVLKSGMDRGAAISYDRLEDVVREMQQS